MLIGAVVSKEKKSSVCPECKEKIITGARKCSKCQAVFGIRGYVSLVVPILSLMVAIFALLPAVLPILFPSKGRISISSKYEHPNFVLTFVNLGTVSVNASSHLECVSKNHKKVKANFIYKVFLNSEAPVSIQPSQREETKFSFSSMELQADEVPIILPFDFDELLENYNGYGEWICNQWKWDHNDNQILGTYEMEMAKENDQVKGYMRYISEDEMKAIESRS